MGCNISEIRLSSESASVLSLRCCSHSLSRPAAAFSPASRSQSFEWDLLQHVAWFVPPCGHACCTTVEPVSVYVGRKLGGCLRSPLTVSRFGSNLRCKRNGRRSKHMRCRVNLWSWVGISFVLVSRPSYASRRSCVPLRVPSGFTQAFRTAGPHGGGRWRTMGLLRWWAAQAW